MLGQPYESGQRGDGCVTTPPVKTQPSHVGAVLATHRGKAKLFGPVVVGLWWVLPGLTSQSKGRAARWRF